MTQMPLPFQPTLLTHRIPREGIDADLSVGNKCLSDDHLRREAEQLAIAVVELRRRQLIRAEQLLQRLVQHG
jgi:hypothetical protein